MKTWTWKEVLDMPFGSVVDNLKRLESEKAEILEALKNIYEECVIIREQNEKGRQLVPHSETMSDAKEVIAKIEGQSK